MFLAIISFSGFCHADEYQFERSCPLNVYNGINTNYGEFRNTSGYMNHDGLDYRAGIGTLTYPIFNGTVKEIDYSGDTGWGKFIVIEDIGKSLQARYAHLSKIFVADGQWVNHLIVFSDNKNERGG